MLCLAATEQASTHAHLSLHRLAFCVMGSGEEAWGSRTVTAFLLPGCTDRGCHHSADMEVLLELE